jgi:hypothetical protein
MLLRVVPLGRNPMELVRIAGATQRKNEPMVLTYDQFAALLGELREPFRTMALLAGAMGLRCSVFASPFTAGRKPYHAWSAQNQVLAPAGRRAKIGDVGWHDLRHSYRTWLDQTGAPLGVQKDLMRHASITTTMDIYGRAVPQAQRQPHGNVVQVLKQAAGAL